MRGSLMARTPGWRRRRPRHHNRAAGSSTTSPHAAVTPPPSDDGFDADEAGEGDLIVLIVASSLVDNRDEGIDLDEAEEGSTIVTLFGVEASRNEDEGLKVDEAGTGDLTARVVDSAIDDSASQQGIQLVEGDEGDCDVRIVDSEVRGNDDEGLASEQTAPGDGRLRLVRSDLRGPVPGREQHRRGSRSIPARLNARATAGRDDSGRAVGAAGPLTPRSRG